MGAVTDLRQNQVELAKTISDLATRLTTGETVIEPSEGVPRTADITSVVSDVVKSESEAINSRLNDIEDISRRDNLLFYGISDHQSEKWEESEECVRDLLYRQFNMHLTEEMIVRAHILGTFVENKTRPIIVEFLYFKTKDSVLSQRAKLKGFLS